MEQQYDSILPSSDVTFQLSRATLQIIITQISWETVKYMDSLGEEVLPNTVCPVRVPGDGNCLLHAISHAIWGTIDYHPILRHLLKQELAENEEFYRNSVDKVKEDAESQRYTEIEYAKFVGDASSTHAFLGFIHIFALSNILRRPIVVYASKSDIKDWGEHEEGVAGTCLPTRHGPESCCAEPIALGWSDEQKNHFVPLCPVEQSIAFEWPKLQVVFKKTLKAGQTFAHYILHAKLNAQRRLLVGPDNLINKERTPIEDEEEDSACLAFQFVDPERGSVTVPVHYFFKDDPHEVAKKVFRGQGFTDNYIRCVGDFLEMRRDEAIRAGRYNPPKSKVRVEKQPRISCKYIPARDEPICITHLQDNQFRQIYQKIIQFNNQLSTERSDQKSTSKFSHILKYLHIMDESGTELLQNLTELLTEHAQNFNTAEFSPAMLDLVTLLLAWPLDNVWPVIDLSRLLVLHQSAANYYLNQTNCQRANMFTILLGTIQVPDLPFNHRQLAIKFVINLFKQPCLSSLLITHSHAVIVVMINCIDQLSYDEDKNIKVITLVTQVFINYASMWKAGPSARASDHKETLSKLLKCLLNILQSHKYPEPIVFNVLVALGTIIQKDGRIKIAADGIEQFRSSNNTPRVRECASHIIDCLNAPILEIPLE